MTFTYGGSSITFPISVDTIDNSIETIRPGTVRSYGGVVTAAKPDVYDKILTFTALLTEAQKVSLVTFLQDTVGLKGYVFTCTPDSGMDIGGGVDVALSVRYWSDSLSYSARGYAHYLLPIILRIEE